MISIASYRVLEGPNPFAPEAVLVALLDFSTTNATDLVQSAEAMGETFGQWWSLPAQPKGEAQDLYIARVLADWCLASLNAVSGFLHQSGAKPAEDGQISLWLGYHRATTSLEALQIGISLLNTMGNGQATPEQARNRVEQFWHSSRANNPDFQARILMEAARSRNIPYAVFSPAMRIWQYGWGARSLKFFESSPEEDSDSGARIAKDKVISKSFLARMGAPTPSYALVKDAGQLDVASRKTGWPCVVKPIDRGQAKGVTVSIRTPDQLRRAFATARTFSKAPIMIESMAIGEVHRLLVVRGKLVAASCRSPASVQGDGESTVMQLAEAFNEQRAEGAAPGNYRGAVPFDEEFDATLASQGIRREGVPKIGQVVRLRNIPLLGTGADNEDVTDLVHPETRALVESLADTLAIAVIGFDYVTPDIGTSFQEAGAFLEFNLTPSLRGHLKDGKDERGVATAVLGPKPSRLPSALIVASPEACSALPEAFAGQAGLGWRTMQAVGIGALRLRLEDTRPFPAFFTLSTHKSVKRFAFACTPEELARHGMPIDKPDLVVADLSALDADWSALLHEQAQEVVPLAEKDDPGSLLVPFLTAATS